MKRKEKDREKRSRKKKKPIEWPLPTCILLLRKGGERNRVWPTDYHEEEKARNCSNAGLPNKERRKSCVKPREPDPLKEKEK